MPVAHSAVDNCQCTRALFGTKSILTSKIWFVARRDVRNPLDPPLEHHNVIWIHKLSRRARFHDMSVDGPVVDTTIYVYRKLCSSRNECR